MHLAYVVDVVDDVSLVECRVSNDSERARSIEVHSRLDGPVWPPRRFGRPGRGWNPTDSASGPTETDTTDVEMRYRTTVPADGRVAFGFASPAAPVRPPVIVEEVQAPPDTRDADRHSPIDILAEYGDPRPPPDAVPDGGSGVGAADRRPVSRESSGIQRT